MKVDEIIEGLRRPDAFPHHPSRVEVRQTHISIVFLAGRLVYKVKKPVDLEFLDFTKLDRREHYCHEEVRLNRRLAPSVYLGVVPLTWSHEEGLRVKGEGDVVEYAVEMRRLDDDATLLARLERNELGPEPVAALGRRIARFHDGAASAPRISRFGRWDVVAGNARENLQQSRSQTGRTLSERVHRRLSATLEERLEELRPLIRERAGRDVPRDTHGDLHLEHVYLFPDRQAPHDLVVIDCIEFNERFRYADPISDMAFLAMDLRFRGRPDLEDRFSSAYFGASGDVQGRALLPFYRSYRAAVRGKVEGMVTEDDQVPEDDRMDAMQRARGHWLLSLSELEPPSRRPTLVMLGGLPGTGKSTLARGLSRDEGFRVISSDRVRKELAGLDPDQRAESGFAEGLYSEEWTERTYRACLERACEGLFEGERIAVDATFRREAHRRTFLEAATAWGVQPVLFLCEAPPETVRRHLDGRESGPSDADWDIYREAAARWEEPGPETARSVERISTGGPVKASMRQVLDRLRERGLSS